MFSFLMKKAGIFLAKKQGAEGSKEKKEDKPKRLSKKLPENLSVIREIMKGSSDIIIREFYLNLDRIVEGALIMVDGLTDDRIINDNIIYPLMHDARQHLKKTGGDMDIISHIRNSLLSASQVKEETDIDEILNGFLNGDVALLVNGAAKALIISSKGWEKRAVNEPPSEAVVRGPRECFIENLRTNTALIRRKIRNPGLTFESLTVGKKTGTNVCIAYIKGVARQELIDTIKKRLTSIDTDAVLESGYIEQYIEDFPESIFATVGFTEKPDVAAAKILEGRAAIIVDGTPFVLTVPLLFVESFQSAEDYYFRPYFANMLRITRVISYAITILAPALYVAITTFHQELLPTSLLLTTASAREGIPFPAFLECLIMLMTFEILREAGVRLPRPVGQALSIVGALVVGESAVSAGIIGAPMVIVVAITALSSFVTPNEADSAAVLRLILLILGAVLGGFGIAIGLLGTLVHLSSLRSFGYPFLYPIAPFDVEDSKDAILRAPLWLMIKRPKEMSTDIKRQTINVPPTGKDIKDNKGELI
ncbi:MAG: spore germination protein [Clostridiales bacterium]|jgi:spore germination protein KA|nr:spore germination protein [Clostridiales bacterium]